MREQNQTWHHTGSWGRIFGILDVRALVPFLLVLFHFRIWTLQLAAFVSTCLVISYLLRKEPMRIAWGMFWTLARLFGASIRPRIWRL